MLLFTSSSSETDESLELSRAKTDIFQIDLALEHYRGTRGVYPLQLADLNSLKGSLIYYNPSLRDPWGNDYQYRNPGEHSGKDYDLYSMGPDGRSRTNGNDKDDVALWKPDPVPVFRQVVDFLIYFGLPSAIVFYAVKFLWNFITGKDLA